MVGVGTRSAAGTATALELSVGTLERLVAEHEPGELLPAEAVLAATLDVSRLTVREALKVLSGRGLVELNRGRRPRVLGTEATVLMRYWQSALGRNPQALLELNEIRQALEVLSASLAAKAGQRAAIAAVAASLEAMRQAAHRYTGSGGHDQEALNAYHRSDVGFHEALGLASGNRMLSLLLESFEPCLRESFVASAQGHFARGRTVHDVVDAHALVLDAVRAGDAKAAGRAMQTHLLDVARDLRAARAAPPESAAGAAS